MLSPALLQSLFYHCITLGKLLKPLRLCLPPMKVGLTLADSQCHHKDQMRSCLQNIELGTYSGDAQPMLIHFWLLQYSLLGKKSPQEHPVLTSPSPFAMEVKVFLFVHVLPKQVVVAPAGS